MCHGELNMAMASQLTCRVITPCSDISTPQAAEKERAAVLPEYIKVKCQWVIPVVLGPLLLPVHVS
jgi:hypothetical protein